jgi:hypothetical protein
MIKFTRLVLDLMMNDLKSFTFEFIDPSQNVYD